MKKIILTAVFAFAAMLSNAASTPPDCGCGDSGFKTMSTPEYLLSPGELRMKKLLLSLKNVDVTNFTFTSEVFRDCQSTWSNTTPPYSPFETQQYDNATLAQLGLWALGFSCVCRKIHVETREAPGGGHIQTRICASVQVILIGQCDCIDEAP